MIRLRELREENNWNMREAAVNLHKAYTTYVNHEKGLREPNSEDLKSYAQAYGVSVDYLIGRTDDRRVPSAPAQSSMILKPEEEQLVTDYREAAPNIQRAAATMLHDSAEEVRKEKNASA